MVCTVGIALAVGMKLCSGIPRATTSNFNLDAVRIASKYPGKMSYKGPNKGNLSGNPKGKNPEDVWNGDDVWNIPNVKGNHREKTAHPCQFPVGLVERLVLALSNRGDLVFDPYAGVASTGVAAALHGRRFIGSEIDPKFIAIGRSRVDLALAGTAKYRPHGKPIYDHRQSKLSIMPSTRPQIADTSFVSAGLGPSGSPSILESNIFLLERVIVPVKSIQRLYVF